MCYVHGWTRIIKQHTSFLINGVLQEASLSSVARLEVYIVSLCLCWETIPALLWPLKFISFIGLLFCTIMRKTNPVYFLPMFFCFHFLLLSFWSIWSLFYSKEWGRNPILLRYLFRWQPSCPVAIRWIISLFFCIWNSIFILNQTCVLEFILRLCGLVPWTVSACTCTTGSLRQRPSRFYHLVSKPGSLMTFSPSSW